MVGVNKLSDVMITTLKLNSKDVSVITYHVIKLSYKVGWYRAQSAPCFYKERFFIEMGCYYDRQVEVSH